MSSTLSDRLDSVKASIYANSSLGESFMKRISFKLDDMLLSCTFDKKECNASHFTQFTSYDKGNCYLFNFDAANIRTSSQTGQYYGLKLELFAGFDGEKDMILSFFIYSFINKIVLLIK